MDVTKTAKVEEKTCARCMGNGTLRCYSHVLRGICFRCWGLGTDPRTIDELECWLSKARLMYAVRREHSKIAESSEKDTLLKEMALIEKLGKQNRKKVENLRRAFKACHDRAKAG